MSHIPKPERTHRYYIQGPNGEAVSERRPRASGAWANAAHSLGAETLKEVEEAVRAMKQQGYTCKKVDGVRVNFADEATGDANLNIRIKAIDLVRIASLIKHYSTKENPVTKTWVIRQLIAEKMESISKRK